MERIAVTGANGFVGRHVVARAAAAGHEVAGIVRSEAAAQVVRDAGGYPVELLGRDPEALVRALDGCRAVVHLAQIGAERGGQTYEAVNVGYTERVLEDARHAGVPRVVCFSGLGVARYGMAPRCSNAYFLSKLAAETILFRSGLEGVVFRPSFVVGPGRRLRAGGAAGDGGGRGGAPRGRVLPHAADRGRGRGRLRPGRDRSPGGRFPHRLRPGGTRARHLRPPARACWPAVARALGRPADLRVREVPLEEADRRARAGGYMGMLPDELDCLLCDETADPAPLEALLGRRLLPLDEALAAAVRVA